MADALRSTIATLELRLAARLASLQEARAYLTLPDHDRRPGVTRLDSARQRYRASLTLLRSYRLERNAMLKANR